MSNLDLSALTEAHAAQLKKLEELQAQYINAFNEVWASLLQQQQSLAEQLQREHARTLSEFAARVQEGSCAVQKR